MDGYIHDEWKVLPKLTVNIGVRYEFVTNPTTNVHPLNTLINPPFGTFQQRAQRFRIQSLAEEHRSQDWNRL